MNQTAETMRALFAEADKAESRGQISTLADKIVSQARSNREGASKVSQQILSEIYDLVVPHTRQGKKEAEIPTEQIKELAQQFWQQKTDKMLKFHRGAHFRGMYKQALTDIQNDPQLSQHLSQEVALTPPMQQIKALQEKAQRGEISSELATKLQANLSESINQYYTTTQNKGHIIPENYRAQMQEKVKVVVEQKQQPVVERKIADESTVERVTHQETELQQARAEFANSVLQMFIKDMDIPPAAAVGLGDALNEVLQGTTKSTNPKSEASSLMRAVDYRAISAQLTPTLNLLNNLHKREDRYS